MSVVFDFNDSLKDVAPISPMSLPIVTDRMSKSGLLMDAFACPSFSVHNSGRA